MPYNVAANMQFAKPVSAALDARDSVLRNALAERQVANAEQTSAFNQQRLTATDQIVAQQRQKEAEAADAQKLHTAMQYLSNVASNPEQFASTAQRMLAHPDIGRILQSNGVTLPDITPQNVQELLAATGAEVGQGPAVPKTPEPFTLSPGQQRFGADGKPIASVAPMPAKGMRIQSDGAGGFSLYEGPDASGIDLTNPSKNLLQTGSINAQSGIDRLSGIRQGFDPRWLTYTEQAKQYMNSIRAKAQGLPFVSKLTPQENSDLAAFSRFKSDTTDNLNRYITEITGAAMGVEEAKRIISTMPSMQDSPAEFQTKLDRVEERLKLVLARSVYTQREGIKFDAVPIDQMRSIMNKRGDEIYKQHLAQLKDPAAAKAATVQSLESEFYQ